MPKRFLRYPTTVMILVSVAWCQAVTIPSGTKVSCRLEQTISSATAEENQKVQLSVNEDVKVGGITVIPQGSVVMGTVVVAQEKRRMGRTGKLDFSIDQVRALDGEFIPLRYTMNKREGGSHAVATGVATAGAAVLFWPAAPFFLLRKGKDVNINKGIVIETFTDREHVLKVASAAPANPDSQSGAIVSITSNVPGADIELDGAFVGNTPTSRPLPAGDHKIVVKSGQKVWERRMQIPASGSISLNAIL